jgi:hypothetical protein
VFDRGGNFAAVHVGHAQIGDDDVEWFILPGAAFVEATSARTTIAPASKNTTSVGEILSFPVRDTNGFPKQISEFFIRFAGFLCNISKPKP